MDSQVLETLAEAAHDVWMTAKLRAGWKFAPVTNKDAKEHHSLLPYHELSEHDKEANRDLVKGIPLILSTAGFTMVRGEQV